MTNEQAAQAFEGIVLKAMAEQPTLERKYIALLSDFVSEALRKWNAGLSSVTIMSELEGYTLRTIRDFKTKFAYSYAVDAYRMAGALLGKSSFSSYEVKVLGDGFEQAPVFDNVILAYLKPTVGTWIETTSRLESRESARAIGRVIQDGLALGQSREEIAKELQAFGLANTPQRAKLLSETGAVWSYSHGALKQFERSGYTTGIWVSEKNERTCVFCREIDGMEFKLGEPVFRVGDPIWDKHGKELVVGVDVYHPPLHPHCQCHIHPKMEGGAR